jgi:hypothetical protein
MPFKILGAFMRALVSNFLGIESKPRPRPRPRVAWRKIAKGLNGCLAVIYARHYVS